MGFFEELRELSAAANVNKRYAKKEASTKSYLIDPFISLLGYKRINPDDVEPEFAAETYATKTPVDYALKKDGEYIIFVECKSAKAVLSSENTSQLQHYFSTKLDVRFGILTNGLEYRFYADLEKPNVMDEEPFLTLDILSLDEKLLTALQLFSKERFEVSECIEAARKLKYKRKVVDVITQTFDPLSDEIIKFLVKKVHSGSYTKPVREQFSPLVIEAWNEFLGCKRVETGDGPPCPSPCPEPSDTDIPVVGYYGGHRFEAELLRKSIKSGLTIGGHQIRYNGETTWLKNAAIMAIRSVDPSFEPTRTFPNGFKFWKVVDPADGKEHMIRYISGWDQTDEALRQRVLNKY